MSSRTLLKRLRHQWERNARFDPYWTIIAKENCRQGRDLEDFFASGKSDIDRVLALAAEAGVVVRPGVVLDFGCGVGRLTRSLAAVFGSAVGVDVSERMIEVARGLHADTPAVRFVHNARPDLAAFASGSLDVVCSLITLQHMPQPLALGYIAEFMRVCRPAGHVIIQIVTRKRTSGNLFWPPTAARWAWRKINSRLALAPVFAMYPLLESEVERVVTSGGGAILSSSPDHAAGDAFESRVLIIRRSAA